MCVTGGCASTRSTVPIGRSAAKIKGSAIIDAEVVWLDSYGMSNFEALHSRVNDARASACAFDLLMPDSDDLRGKPYSERRLFHTVCQAIYWRIGTIGVIVRPLITRHTRGGRMRGAKRQQSLIWIGGSTKSPLLEKPN
jgi:hypothetical protein